MGASLIQQQDRVRRAARLAQELEAFEHGEYDYLGSRNITGAPSNANRQPKASESCWDTRSTIVDGRVKRVGRIKAVGGDVKVTLADGTTYIRPATDFRGEAKRRRGESDAEQKRNEREQQKERLLRNAGLARGW
jgi:hypothetical protein